MEYIRSGAFEIPVLYEDNHLLVIDKPAGLLSQEDITGDADVLSICKTFLKDKYQKPGNVFLGLVHRLDRPVSGVMVLAKTSKAASRISGQIREHSVRKKYQAVAEGSAPNSGEWKHHLEKNKVSNKSKVVSTGLKTAAEAKLKFSTIARKQGFSLVEIELITGRSHQIRVQFSSEGFPLAGDTKYGSKTPLKDISLRSHSVELLHPTGKHPLRFEVSLPAKYPWNLFVNS